MNYTQWYAQNGKFQKHEIFIRDNLMLETIMGSHAYGCETATSDKDIVGIVVPKREHLFPQEYGFILGFDNFPKFQRKEMKGPKKRVKIGNTEIEAEWINLIEFFVQAGLKGSPNLIEVLFARRNLVTVGDKMGFYLRDKRREFLSMKQFHSFRGYANGQMHRIRARNPETKERKKVIESYGYDLKMAMHTLRLLDQIDQILTTNDLDLMRNKEECKLMRKGEWGDFDRFERIFQERMDILEKKAATSSLAPQPKTGALKALLSNILDHYYDFDNRRKDTDYVSAKDVDEKLNKILKLLEGEEND